MSPGCFLGSAAIWYIYMNVVSLLGVFAFGGFISWAGVDAVPRWLSAVVSVIAIAFYVGVGYSGMRMLRILGAPRSSWIPATVVTVGLLGYGVAATALDVRELALPQLAPLIGLVPIGLGMWWGLSRAVDAMPSSQAVAKGDGVPEITCIDCIHASEFPDCPNDYSDRFRREDGPGQCVFFEESQNQRVSG